MKIKEGFELRSVAGETVVVATGVENVNFSKLVALNATAAYLWGKVAEMSDFSVETLTSLLVAKYEVDESVAQNDAQSLAEQWSDAGIIEL